MRLIDCFAELFSYVSSLVENIAGSQPPFDQVKAEIHRLMKKSIARFNTCDFSKEDYDTACFAVCAWIDESIMRSQWNEKKQWAGEKLSRIYFQENLAGETFFRKLEDIGAHQRLVREVYYMCLAMGFMGKFAQDREGLHLEKLKSSNLMALFPDKPLDIASLERETLFMDDNSDDANQKTSPMPKRRISFLTLAGIIGPVLFFVILYGLFHMVLTGIAGDILSPV